MLLQPDSMAVRKDAESADTVWGATNGGADPMAALQRSVGKAEIAFKQRDGHTVLDRVYQSGCCKVRFPRPEPNGITEAVLLNTAGGLTDGDAVETRACWGRGTCATVATQAAERIYRSRGANARITNRLEVRDAATALWLPQETILFDGGRFSRRFIADVAGGACLIACEATVFGRHAMGEHVQSGVIEDSWRIRYDGRLVFADGFRLEGDMASTLDRPSIADGARAMATVVQVGRTSEEMVSALRDVTDGLGCKAACTQIGPVLVVRVLAGTGAELRGGLIAVLGFFLAGHAAESEPLASSHALPRVWNC